MCGGGGMCMCVWQSVFVCVIYPGILVIIWLFISIVLMITYLLIIINEIPYMCLIHCDLHYMISGITHEQTGPTVIKLEKMFYDIKE